MSRAHRTTFRQLWWAPFVCLGAAWALGLTSILRQLEWRTLDWRTEFRAIWQKPPDPRIAIVLFEDETDAMLSWPPDRQWHGTFNDLISRSKPAVVTWDVILDASREGEGDAIMGTLTKVAIARGSQVVIGAATSADPVDLKPGPGGPTRPLPLIEGDVSAIPGEKHAFVPFPELRAVALWGFVEAPRASDGIVREIPLVVRFDGKVYPSLSLQTLMAYFKVPPEKVSVRLGDAIDLPTREKMIRIPISAHGSYLINHRYDQRESDQDFPTYTYKEVLVRSNEYYEEKKPGAIPPPKLEGKIVLIGQTVLGKADIAPTQRGALSPLVLMHGNVVNNILAGDFARRVPDWALWLVALAIGFGGLFTLADRSVMVLCGGSILGFVIYVSLSVWAWVWQSWWVPLAAPLVGFGTLQFIIIGRRIVQEQRQKQEIKGMFGSYLSPVLVERMIKQGQLPQLGGHEEEITAFFSDIQGFSAISENLPPDRLVALMNEYLTACTDIIQAEQGTLDKYIGDAVVAIYGAPTAQAEHAFRACVAAERVQLRIAELRAKWRSEGDAWPQVVWNIRARIGLNTGRCVVGNMGSRSRFSYTMMGDNVNLASRMESGAKSWGVYSMCSETTKLACEKHGGDRIVFRPLGRIVVKGRAHLTPIFEIVGLKENVAAQSLECIGIFAQGLERYLARDWDGALALFRRSAPLEPNQPGAAGVSGNPSLVYVEIVEHFKAEPPGENWDGVYHMKEK
ncbi:MAG: adenylate/guanylate cyclase domain-containing protein [Opitutus sp.]|nr:adenylate/guanylate cyclase domain-containing protein [Opitutus sp.]